MAYQIIDSFAAGLDTRKSPLTSAAGTLTRLVNAVITPGGEIQKRRAFKRVLNAAGTPISLAGSFGLASTEARLFTFGRNVLPPVQTLNPGYGVTLNGLIVPNAAPDIVQFDYDVFDGKIYVACNIPSAPWPENVKHYYDLATDDATSPNLMVVTEGTGKGLYVRTYQSKVYSVIGKFIYFSAIDDPIHWDSGTGAGNINLSLQDANSETLTSIEVYYDKIAIFSSEAVQIWAVDADPAQNVYIQLLRGAGTTSPRSPLQYGAGDVLYLDQSGIRSLKARDSSNSAAVSDIGSPVDPTIQALRVARGADYMNRAIALLEPSVGRFWQVFPDRVMALSYFPAPKITAWSELTLLDENGLPFIVQHAVTCAGRIFIRTNDDRLYVYGGITGDEYDRSKVEVRLPYLDAKKPGHKKQFLGFDATVSGSWTVAVSYNFNDPDAEEIIGAITQPTWNMGTVEMVGFDSHYSLRFYNESDGAATISNCAAHYNMAGDED